MSNKLARPRLAAFNRQSGRCFYCDFPMWLGSPTAFIAKYRFSKNQATILQCTAEHLLARKDGGGNSQSNIVAACLICNRRRHQGRKETDATQYRHIVQTRVKQKRWHFPWVFERVVSF